MSVDIAQLTAHLTPRQQEEVKTAYKRQAEHATAAFLYCFFLGIFGAHRFYLRQWGQGWLHLLLPLLAAGAIAAHYVVPGLDWPIVAAIVVVLLLIALVWEIIDLFRIDGDVRDRNLKLAERLIAKALLADPSVEQAAAAQLDTVVRETVEQAASAAHHEEAVAEAAATSAAAPVAAEVEAAASDVAAASEVAAPEQAPASAVAAEEMLEEAVEEARADTSAAVSTGEYVATAVTQISADADEAKHEHVPEQPAEAHDWSMTETTQIAEVQSDEVSAGASDLVAADAATDAEAVAQESVASAETVTYTEAVTRAHTEDGYTVTDSEQTIRTVSAAEAVQADEAAVVEEVAEAPVAPAPELGRVIDYTDMAAVAGEIAPIADVDPSGSSPFHVMLPSESASVDVPDAAVVIDDGAGEAIEAAPDAEVQMVAEDAVAEVVMEPVAAVFEPEPGIEALGWGEPGMAATPSESYIPPTIPSVVMPAAEPEIGEEPAAADPVIMPAAMEAADEPADTVSAPEVAEPMVTEAAVVAAAMVAAAEPVMAEPVAAEPIIPEPVMAAEPVAAEPVMAAEPVVAAEPMMAEPMMAEPVVVEPVVAELAASGEPPVEQAGTVVMTAEEHHDELPSLEGGASHHRMKRIRVKREFKVGDQVVETTYAEEYIDVDADPEPVRQRLQQKLHEEAQLRQGQGQG